MTAAREALPRRYREVARLPHFCCWTLVADRPHIVHSARAFSFPFPQNTMHFSAVRSGAADGRLARELVSRRARARGTLERIKKLLKFRKHEFFINGKLWNSPFAHIQCRWGSARARARSRMCLTSPEQKISDRSKVAKILMGVPISRDLPPTVQRAPLIIGKIPWSPNVNLSLLLIAGDATCIVRFIVARDNRRSR